MVAKAPAPILPVIPFRACPIRASIGILGRKWALLVIRDIGLRRILRFNGLVRANPGLTPRALSLLLRDLQREGLILRVEDTEGTTDRIRYSLTKKGTDVLPVIASLIAFGMRHYADRVFDDGEAHDLADVFPGQQAALIGPLLPFASKAIRGRSAKSTASRPPFSFDG
jgi:DNA-binding HxlR family transcriptional regulator